MGFRIAIKSARFDSSARLAVAGAAANATLNGASMQLDIWHSPGLPADVVEQIGGLGSLSAENMDKFGEHLEKAVSSMLDEDTVLTPSPVALVLRSTTPYSTWSAAVSTSFALGQIARRKSYTDAARRLDDLLDAVGSDAGDDFAESIDSAVVRATYAQFKVNGADQTPSAVDARTAEDHLWCGWGAEFNSSDPADQIATPAPAQGTPGKIVPVDYKALQFVSPYTDAAGAVIALEPYGSLVAPPAPAFGKDYEGRLLKSEVSTDMALSLGFTGVEAEGSLKARYFLWSNLRAVAVEAEPGSIVKHWIYGVGFQICIKAIGTNLAANISIPSVAASSTLGQASATYEVRLQGVDLQAFSSLSSLMSAGTGPFTTTTLTTVGAAGAELAKVLARGTVEQVEPTVVGVVLDRGSPQLSGAVRNAQSAAFALGAIAKRRRPLATALEKAAARHFDQSVVREIYGTCTNDPQAPSKEEAAVASAVLYAGWRG